MPLIPQTIPFVIGGNPQVEGLADGSFGGTFDALGNARTRGTAAASFGGTLTAFGSSRLVTVWSAAVVEATPAAGQASKAFGGTFTASGTTAFLGQAVAAFGGTFAAIGRRNISAWSGAVVEVTPAGGQAVGSFGGSFTGAAKNAVEGVAQAAFGGSPTATGYDRVLGLAATSFSVGNFTATGTPRALGVAAAAFGGTFSMVTNVTRSGLAVALFGGTFKASHPTPGQAVVSFGPALTVNGLVIEPVFLFSPPTHEEPMRTDVRPLNYHRLTHATSLVRIGGVLTPTRSPSHDLLKAAGLEGVDWFIGGHVYRVSRDTKTELNNLGYEVTQQ